MGYASLPWRSEVDGQVYRFCDDDLADAEYEAGLYKELTLRHWMTVREIADMALAVLKEEAVGEGRPLEELRRRMAEMKQDAALLTLPLPMAELIEIVARTSANFEWIIDRLGPGPKREKAEAELIEWKARMIPLLERIGWPEGRPVLRRRKKIA
jgi:hypothetical protein